MNYFEEAQSWLESQENLNIKALKSLFISASEKRFSKTKNGKDTLAFVLKEFGSKDDPNEVDEAMMDGDYGFLTRLDKKNLTNDKIEKIKDEL